MPFVCAITGLTFLVTASGILADETGSAMSIVDRAIKAHGGAEKLNAAGQSWKANGKMMMGGADMPYSIEYFVLFPGKVRFDMDMDQGGQKVKLVVATNGKTAWQQAMGQVMDMPKEKLDEFHNTVYVMSLGRLLPLKEKGVTLTPLGESKHGDQTLVGLKVSQPNQRDVSMFFDKSTGLLTKTISKVKDEFQGWKDATQEAIFTGYHDKDGRKVFNKLTLNRDGKPFIVEEISDQKILAKVDPAMFEKPAPAKK